MTVLELIKILKKCDPFAQTHFCYGDNQRVDVVDFVEFDASSGSVFFYENEPAWGNDSSLDGELELDTITSIGDGFAETTYREATSAEEKKEIQQAISEFRECLFKHCLPGHRNL